MAEPKKEAGGDLRRLLIEQIAAMPASRRKQVFAQLRSNDAEKLLKISRNRQGNEFPLSAGQRQLWILQKFEPESGAYNSCLAVRFRGKLTVGLLESALEYVECRHEILRTSFPLDEEGPLQVVHEPQSGEMRRVDLRCMPGERSWAWVNAFLADESRRPFDVEQPPLFRKILLLLSEEDLVLMITLHHILCDEWSTGILAKEAADLYQAMKRGDSNPAVPEVLQYADFAVWQQQNQNSLFQAQLQYWAKALAGLQPIALPTDYPRPEYPSFRGEVLSLPLHAGTAAWAMNFARQTGTTFFIVLLTAFEIFLSHWTGEGDIAVGTPVANRNVPMTETMLGFFVNTIVLRSRIDWQKTFHELVRQVGHNAIEAYANQDTPFEMVVEKLRPSRSFNSSPLFQVMFQTVHPPALVWPELDVEALKVPRTTSKFDLTLFIREAGEDLLCEWNYATDLFKSETILDAAHHFTALLDAIAESPDFPVGNLLEAVPQRSSPTTESRA
jgi:Condensation domain